LYFIPKPSQIDRQPISKSETYGTITLDFW
jgi:hypothetical protein